MIGPVRVKHVRADNLSTCVQATVSKGFLSAYVTDSRFSLSAPSPVVNGLPCENAIDDGRIPNGGVVAEVIRKVSASPGFVNHRNVDVHIKVPEVDDIGAATERTKGWSARRYLGPGDTKG